MHFSLIVKIDKCSVWFGLVLWHINEVGDRSPGRPKVSFSIATISRCRRRPTSFPGLLHFTHDPYLIMLSVKQGGIKYHFLKSLVWLDLGLNPGLPAIGEHSTHLARFIWYQIRLIHIYQVYMIGKHESKWSGSKYCNVSLTIQLNITHLDYQTVLFQTI